MHEVLMPRVVGTACDTRTASTLFPAFWAGNAAGPPGISAAFRRATGGTWQKHPGTPRPGERRSGSHAGLDASHQCPIYFWVTLCCHWESSVTTCFTSQTTSFNSDSHSRQMEHQSHASSSRATVTILPYTFPCQDRAAPRRFTLDA